MWGRDSGCSINCSGGKNTNFWGLQKRYFILQLEHNLAHANFCHAPSGPEMANQNKKFKTLLQTRLLPLLRKYCAVCHTTPEGE
jgi:hypothetical protein